MKKIFTVLCCLFFFSNVLLAQQWTKVSCGLEFSIALRSDGTLWAWGANFNGQLGNGSQFEKASPVRVGTDNDWADVQAGGFHCLALKTNGSLWAWGVNANEELGDGTDSDRISPVRIGTATDWKMIATGTFHSLAIKNNGTLWAWGYNVEGQLGTGDTLLVLAPTQIGTDTTWQQVSGGGLHTVAVKKDGTLWAWGFNDEGQLGDGTFHKSLSPEQIGTDNDWAQVSGGFEFTLGKKANGSIWSWGFNGNGQLGIGNNSAQKAQPTQIGTATNWKLIAAGSSFGFAITTDSVLYSWGFNGSGQLGLGNTNQQMGPVMVESSTGWFTIAAAKGDIQGNSLYGLHAMGLENDGSFICTAGAGYIGQLGDGSQENDEFTCDIAVTTGINEINHAGEINVYPNPTNGEFTLAYPGLSNGSVLEIKNIFGQNVSFSSTNDYTNKNMNVNVTGLPAGIYFVQLVNKNGGTTTAKVLVN